MYQMLEQIKTLNFPAQLPATLLAVEQTFDRPCVDDVAGATRAALNRLLPMMTPGSSVAVGVGSRGIANLSLIVRTTIDRMKAAGLKPFIIPAMGSHAGATAEGQEAMLAKLGVTKEMVGAEVRSSMEVVQIGQIPDGPPLFQDKLAAGADYTFLINRVKAHTAFRGRLESGLAKMEIIGIGKQHGASLMHNLGIPAFENYLAPAARIYETASNVAGGLAIVENAYEEIAEIAPLTAAEIGSPLEEEMLVRAKNLMPSIPFPEIEMLGVRQFGKDISGAGMDPNIIGRLFIPRQAENFGGPDICLICVLDLTKTTGGNANGIGLANVVPYRVTQKINWQETYMNAMTAGILGMQRSSLPITMASDKAALEVALRNCGQPQESARLVFIKDTLTLDHMWVSPNLQAEVEAHPRLAVTGEVPLNFTAEGTMTSPWQMNDEL
jgi:hypothetical protein